MDQTNSYSFIGELHYSVATCLSLYKCQCAHILQGCCRLDGSGKFPVPSHGFLVDHSRSYTNRWAGYSLPSYRGSTLRCSSSGRNLRDLQRELDENHANDGAARELACGVARAKSRVDQRCASWTRAKW